MRILFVFFLLDTISYFSVILTHVMTTQLIFSIWFLCVENCFFFLLVFWGGVCCQASDEKLLIKGYVINYNCVTGKYLTFGDAEGFYSLICCINYGNFKACTQFKGALLKINRQIHILR
ncbi:hypothetical protein EGW08_003790 [Elysia chlorotica]|uniref:Uncharacterized protein n=1 Tax=Elysia chlorotica TaxID=188477 RepID=A0A3S0ZXJ7_ELYCH|nr:hypothetical protein EGW08_003790 [Elysia chlorotica]